MPATIEVRFKGNRKGYFNWPDGEASPHLQEAVIVEVDRGRDLGRVSAVGETAAKKCGGCTSCATGESPAPETLPRAVGRATQEDLAAHNRLRQQEEQIRRTVIERVRAHHLGMKISDAEWQWDRKKLTIYFTAEKRVDFRALVRDLAAVFHTRIELRQIGVRDEAARLSGIGRCGREYCCSTWLTTLSPVNLGLAKDQHLSLNPQQISGGCGRLLCCLKYEHDYYVTARKRFPKEGRTLETAQGTERVVAVDIFRERVLLRGAGEGQRTLTLIDLRAELDQLAASRPDADRQIDREPEPAAVPPPSADAAPEPEAAGAEPEHPTARARRRRRGRRRRGGGSGGSGGGTGGEA